MSYKGTIYRPPVEASTFLLPVTEGCSHNKCRFCSMYHDVSFRMLSLEEIEKYLKRSIKIYKAPGQKIKRIYLVGADPFAMSFERLKSRLDLIKRYIPECETITMYAAVRNIITKTDEELATLRSMGIDDLYVGIESGLDDVLSNLNKGNSLDEARKQSLRLNGAGIAHMDMLMLGAGGAGLAKESAIAAAKLLNETKPKMILINSMSLFPETELGDAVKDGTFITAGEKEMLLEERLFIEKLELPETYFWAAHSLNAVRFEGYLGEEKQAMIRLLDEAIKVMDEEKFQKSFLRETRSI